MAFKMNGMNFGMGTGSVSAAGLQQLHKMGILKDGGNTNPFIKKKQRTTQSVKANNRLEENVEKEEKLSLYENTWNERFNMSNDFSDNTKGAFTKSPYKNYKKGYYGIK